MAVATAPRARSRQRTLVTNLQPYKERIRMVEHDFKGQERGHALQCILDVLHDHFPEKTFTAEQVKEFLREEKNPRWM